jgi:hypothetical protein
MRPMTISKAFLIFTLSFGVLAALFIGNPKEISTVEQLPMRLSISWSTSRWSRERPTRIGPRSNRVSDAAATDGSKLSAGCANRCPAPAPNDA